MAITDGAEEILLLPRTMLRETWRLQHSIPLRAVPLAADASWRAVRASHRTMRRRHFVGSALAVLIAPLRAVASLQLERPIVASTNLERLIVEKHEMGMSSEIVSKTAVQGESISLRDVRPIGIAIGIAATTIGGTGTVAISLTATGFIYNTGFYPYDYSYPYG